MAQTADSTPIPTADRLATEFLLVIQGILPSETLARIDADNAARAGTSLENLCGTDDECDANEAMLHACSRAGWAYAEMDFGCAKQANLINEAWSIAKRRGFSRRLDVKTIPTIIEGGET